MLLSILLPKYIYTHLCENQFQSDLKDCIKNKTKQLPHTELAVVFPSAVHRAVWQDFQVETGSAVKLSPPQDAL